MTQNWYFFESAYGGCRYYRQILPIRHLYRAMRENRGVHMRIGKDMNEMSFADVVFFSRNIGAENLVYIRRLKKLGKMIVWDMDDDLTIPECWAQQDKWYVVREIASLLECLELADLVTVSTDGLAAVMGRNGFAVKTVVVPNAIDLMDWVPTNPKPSNVILYAGTSTHQRDLGLVRDLYARTCHDMEWVFFGCQPKWMGSIGTYIPLTSIRDYPRLCRMLGPRICLAPLVPCPFNEAKSPIKIWEMATTGATVVASDTGPYRGYAAAVVPEGAEFREDHLFMPDVGKTRWEAGENSWGVAHDGPARRRCGSVFEFVADAVEARQSSVDPAAIPAVV